jgi:hypothetical protein
VLENHHCATGFMIARAEESAVLQTLSKEQHEEFRRIAITLVMATDMAKAS